jgi:hypothetical protein
MATSIQGGALEYTGSDGTEEERHDPLPVTLGVTLTEEIEVPERVVGMVLTYYPRRPVFPHQRIDRGTWCDTIVRETQREDRQVEHGMTLPGAEMFPPPTPRCEFARDALR